MEASKNPSIRDCARYWWEHFKAAWEVKETFASRLAALAVVLGLLLIALQSIDLLPASWSDSQIAFFAEAAAVWWGILYLLFWMPYCGHFRLKSQIEGLEQKIVEQRATD